MIAGPTPDANPSLSPSVAVPTPMVTIRHRGSGGQWPWPGTFLLRYGHTQLELGPHTYCYQAVGKGACVDGFDGDPPSIGSPEELFVFVPVPDVDELVVSQSVGDAGCASSVAAAATSLGNGWWLVRPRGAAKEYRVSLLASGSGAGDMVADVIWQTPSDQELPDPLAEIALIANHDGRPDSYGVELRVDGLPASPKRASATITVTAANGRSLTFDATERSIGCGPLGAVSWQGPADKGKQAAGLGDFPFTITVDLVLDGVSHHATATYPDDRASETDTALPLQFEPSLA